MVHQYQLNGYNIVLDTCSGSVHVVDEVAYDVIAMYPEHTADEIVAAMLAKYGSRPDVTEEDLRQCIDDVTSLKENGKLWSPDVYKDMAFDFKNRNTVVKALCLHVAHSCNLSCSYCFASQGRYHGDRALMSFEVGKRAMDFLIENSGTRRNLEVDFFGGEPLMNFDMVKKLVAYCREQEKIHNKNFRFTMTTNGMLIDDDVIDFCNKECHNVVLSLDGRKEVHDRFRKDYAGRGSYDAIVPKFLLASDERGVPLYHIVHAGHQIPPDLLARLLFLGIGNQIVIILRLAHQQAQEFSLVPAGTFLEQISRPRLLQLQHGCHKMSHIDGLRTTHGHFHKRKVYQFRHLFRRFGIVFDVLGYHLLTVKEFLDTQAQSV